MKASKGLPLEKQPNRKLLNEVLVDLFLWGEGFSGGRLDKVVERSDSLKSAILGFLSNIVKTILDGELIPIDHMRLPFVGFVQLHIPEQSPETFILLFFPLEISEDAGVGLFNCSRDSRK